MVNQVNDILNNASSKCGLIRERYAEKSVTQDFHKVCVIVFFGEIDHLLCFNQLYFQNIKSSSNFRDKYIILVTYSGFGNIIEGVDEVWSAKNTDINEKFYERSDGVNNYSEALVILHRNLNEHFFNIIKSSSLSEIFNHGFCLNKTYKEKIKIDKTLSINRNYLNRQIIEEINIPADRKTVVILPLKFIKLILNGKVHHQKISSSFYENICERMSQKGFRILLCKNYLTYDLSNKFLNNKNIINIKEDNWYNLMGYIEEVGIYIDFFGGFSCVSQYIDISNISLLERSYFYNLNKNQIESILTNYKNINKKHFTFFQFFSDENKQKNLFIDQLMRMINNTLLNPQDKIQQYEVDVNTFLQNKIKKFYTKLIGYRRINERKM